MRRLMLAVALAALPSAPARASQPKRSRPPASTPPAFAARNLKVSFLIRLGGLERSGNFVVAESEQGNYVVGGDTAAARGSPAAKEGTIFNVVPTIGPEDPSIVDWNLQAELSGPLDKSGEVRTFQIQTRVRTTLGQPFVVVDEPDRRLEIRADRVGP